MENERFPYKISSGLELRMYVCMYMRVCVFMVINVISLS